VPENESVIPKLLGHSKIAVPTSIVGYSSDWYKIFGTDYLSFTIVYLENKVKATTGD
jgi:hypothetical protein